MFMAFFEKIKELFKTNSEISPEKVKEVLSENAPASKEERTPKTETDLKSAVEKSELLDILDSVKIDYEYLALGKMQSESETIANYTRNLLQDLDKFQPYPKDKVNIDKIIEAIGRKMKLIARHGLSLKNLLAALEDHYYAPIAEALNKVNGKLNKKEIQDIIDKIEKQRHLITAMDSSLTKVVGYDNLFNPERNPEYRKEIEKEAKQRLIHGHLNELLDNILLTATDKTLNIKSQIEGFNPIHEARRFV